MIDPDWKTEDDLVVGQRTPEARLAAERRAWFEYLDEWLYRDNPEERVDRLRVSMGLKPKQVMVGLSERLKREGF